MATFGYQLPNFSYGTPDSEMFDGAVARVRAAESAGFESVWVMDHFYQLPALGGAPQPILEAYTLLGALAAVTERVDLGTLVTGVTYRNPAMLAKQVTTLDVISGGRAILGIGAAWHDIEHTGLGFDFPPVKERMDRLEEAVQICRAMFTEDAPSFTGTHYRTEEVRNVPRPLRGFIPIMIGGSGERRTLKLVAQYADLCNISGDADSAAQARRAARALRAQRPRPCGGHDDTARVAVPHELARGDFRNQGVHRVGRRSRSARRIQHRRGARDRRAGRGTDCRRSRHADLQPAVRRPRHRRSRRQAPARYLTRHCMTALNRGHPRWRVRVRWSRGTRPHRRHRR